MLACGSPPSLQVVVGGCVGGLYVRGRLCVYVGVLCRLSYVLGLCVSMCGGCVGGACAWSAFVCVCCTSV